MARTTINTQVIPDGTIVSADLSYPLTDFSSTGIDDNASSTSLTIDSSGNITVTGTVDGRDLATDGTKLDGIATSATANPNALDNIVEDTTPQLGGNLDFNGNLATSFTSTGIDDNATTTAITIDSSQDVTFTSDAFFPDNGKAIFGAGSDLQIYHDGSNSYIRENGTGLLYIGATDKLLIQDSTLTNTSAKFDTNADVSLYYNNDKRLETTSTGIDVTGDVNSDSVTTGTFTSTGIDDNATSTAITIDSSQNTTFAGTITSGDITVADGTPFIRLQDSDGTNQYTQISNVNGNGYIGARNDAADAILVVGGYGEGTFTEWARWSNTGNLTQKNNLIVQGTFTSLGIDDNATSTAITINSSENVGIGETDPSDGKLQISASATAGVFVQDSSSSGAAPYIRVQGRRSDGNGSESFSGGLALEGYRTDAAVSNGKALGTIYFGGNHTDGSESNIAYGASIVGKAEGTFNSASDMPTGLAFFTGSTGRDLGTANVDFGIERIRIDSSGRVGIGTSSPARLLHLESADPAIRIKDTSGTGTIHELITSGTNGNLLNLLLDAGGAGTSPAFIIKNVGTELMRVNSSGNLLVGTTVTSQTSGVGYKYINSASAPVAGIVGTPTSGSRVWSVYSTGAAAYRFHVDYAGTISATSTSITGISDASLKENVRDLDKGLDTINALQPRRFDWKNGDGNDIMGFIAQEVETVMPELVHDFKYNDEETKLGLKMGDMIPSMVKAIQELSAQVTELKAEVAALKGA